MRLIIISILLLCSCKSQLEVDKCTNLSKKQVFRKEIEKQEDRKFVGKIVAGGIIIIHAILGKVITDKYKE